MSYVYILYSKEKDGFYIGSTNDHPAARLKQHNEAFFAGAYTQQPMIGKFSSCLIARLSSRL